MNLTPTHDPPVPQRISRAFAVAAAIVLVFGSVRTAASAPTVGGTDQTSEDFGATGGWRTMNMTPGCLPAGVTLTGNHLLISEVAPRGAGTGAGSDSSEYLELYNPTSDAISLDNYYLSDDATYYRIVYGPYALPAVVDYNLRFPPGSTIQPGEVVLVVKSELGFLTTFGGLGGIAGFCSQKIFAMDNRVHPPTVFTPMIDAAGSSLNTSGVGGGDIAGTAGAMTNPSNTNGEWVVLYQWDGVSDLVCDVDYASWGFGVGGNNPKMNKTGVSIQRSLETISTYNSDTPIASQSSLPTVLLSGFFQLEKPMTYQRVDGEVGETQSGGNGCTQGIPCPPVGPAGPVSGPSFVCAGSSGASFSIASVSGATLYTWTVPASASIASGQGSTSITVDFGAAAGTVSVTPGSACATGTPASLAVTSVDNVPPVVTCPADISRLVDANACTAVVTFAPTASDNCSTVSIVSTPTSGSAFPIGTTTVNTTATDASGNVSSCSFPVTVSNPLPACAITAPSSGTVVAIGVAVPFAGSFTDNTGDTHTAQWYFDGVPAGDPVTVSGSGSGSGTLSMSHTFTAAGVYMVSLKVTDQCGGASATSQVGGLDAMVVVYDPSAGFVSGGGWINSPVGAYRANPDVTGKANFGFVSKYKKGATVPTGETEFQFKAAGMNFHSTSYSWLVISGARAQYKGFGTINCGGNYSFTLTASDGDLNGQGVDKLRIKITDAVTGAMVYDNQLGDSDNSAPSTALGGGSIVIRSSGIGCISAALQPEQPEQPMQTESQPVAFTLGQSFPNPFRASTEIRFSLPERSTVRLAVYDIGGREIACIADGDMESGNQHATWSGRDRGGNIAPGGVYFVRMTARSVASGARFTSSKRVSMLN